MDTLFEQVESLTKKVNDLKKDRIPGYREGVSFAMSVMGAYAEQITALDIFQELVRGSRRRLNLLGCSYRAPHPTLPRLHLVIPLQSLMPPRRCS